MTRPIDLRGNEVGFALALPPDSMYIRLARMLVAALAVDSLELPDMQVDALRLAVSEAFTAALREHVSAGSSDAIGVHASVTGRELEVRLEHAGDPVPDEPHLVVARALVETVEAVAGPAITIRLRLRPQ